MKVYEVDTAYFDVPIARGKTIVKVILKKDVEMYISRLEKKINQIFKELERESKYGGSENEKGELEAGIPNFDEAKEKLFKFIERVGK